MIREIVKHPAKILTQPCKEVTVIDEEIITLLDDMYETMVEYDGMGIAAPQVNVPLRIAIVELGEERTLIEMINPTVIETDGSSVDIEGCLSFPGLYGEVERSNYVKIEAHDRNGQVYQLEATDYDARCILHEIDHLDGILFNSKITRVYTEEELEEMFEEEEE
ncbi:peptide deformylase [Ureibacillus thermosphaericus]|uniref:Peptide deformylase n=1 Tax=Ureibacillus thermosphaericus TaxID=51173 RepID=A0A840PR59_URETH|nr:peptide deformylase [Ureibacillus thermosphaericus]MBB5148979.1 peptide deformylase [Ureibacillus thermosphaericus]NKZ30924.1 peptide deformylase [Ureibacillus thermosphaericus]